MATCGFRPFPGDGAYGDWACGLKRWHFGRHRYENYTIARVPRLHAAMWVLAKVWARYLTVAWSLRPQVRMHWHRTLWPTRYEPEAGRP